MTTNMPESVDVSAIEKLFGLQRAHCLHAAQTNAHERRTRLLRLKQAILAHRQTLYAAFETDFGKPRVEVEMLEIQPTLAEIDYAVAHLGRWMRPVSVATPFLLSHARSEIRYEPRGMVLILAPWNYPLLLLITPLVGAVAAGNCVIARLSEKVPHVAAVINRIITAAFPAREVAMVGGDIAVADALLELPFDHIFFTGNGAVGRKVMRAAANHLASVTLELGGKSPAIVDASADMEQTAARLVWGRFVNAGQTCVSPDYVLVQAEAHDQFLAAAKRVLARFYGATEHARLYCADMAQIIDHTAFQRLTNILDAAVGAGATIEIGGTNDVAARRIAPTLLSHVAQDNPIMTEEIFGPILPVLAYQTLDQALGIINSHDKPLALYVFSQNQSVVETVLRRTPSGGVVVNNTVVHLANPNLPFGGIGPSGMGNYHGEHGFRAFSHQRAVLQQSRLSFGSLFFPPYRRSSAQLAALTEALFYRALPALRRIATKRT